jgi:polyhydroxyalkanoate synthesis regulator phasin
VDQDQVNEDRIVEQLHRMVETGRISDAEAQRLRSTRGTAEFAAVLNEVRARHAAAHLDRAVEEGRMGAEQAADFLDRVRAGDHSRRLRCEIRGSG